ncbi:DUF2536 family protein [Mesobacillus maritimus]
MELVENNRVLMLMVHYVSHQMYVSARRTKSFIDRDIFAMLTVRTAKQLVTFTTKL